jgi:16S rRNA processing protein RimM
MRQERNWESAACSRFWNEFTDDRMKQEQIIIGKLLKTHGLHGAFKAAVLTDAPERFRNLKSVILESPSGIHKVCTILSVRGNRSQVVLSCREMTSIEEAEPFVKGWIKIPRSESISLSDHQYYRFDLIGVSVYFRDGQFLGIIEDILETGSNDVFVVRRESKEYLIPAIRQVVEEIDIQQKRMVIDRMEGLIEHHAV